MARKIVITSGKGGVGKTTIAVRLGLCLAARGDRVVLADADVGLAAGSTAPRRARKRRSSSPRRTSLRCATRIR